MFETKDGNLHVFSDEDIDRIFASENVVLCDNADYAESRFSVDVPALITPLLSDKFLLAA
jgi:hypothetical protein